MRRISFWMMSTFSALVLLFGYHTSTTSQLAAGSTHVISGGTSTGATGTGSAVSGTFTGDSVSTRWGPVQVQITVGDGAVTSVAVPVYPSSSGKDVQINNRALPVLISETTSAQSAQIDMVSGATITSRGYLTSLQSALDQAGL